MKAAGSYETLIRGVSQQVPQDRQPGQHSEQVNMISDPVNGLSRRHGSRLLAERVVAGAVGELFDTYTTDTDSYRTLEYSSGGSQFVVMYRTKARPSGSTLPLMVVYNRTSGVFHTINRNVTDTALDAAEAAGISAITAVGKYLFFAANGIAVGNTSSNVWEAGLNSSVAWVRGGVFSRTYTLRLKKMDNAIVTVTYTTPAASYQGTLSTTDIPSTATDYTKQVNDRVNAYNSAVTQWIGTSTAAVQPSAIATQLQTIAYYTHGVYSVVQGSHIYFPDVKSISVDDGGDGSLLLGVGDEVASVDDVTAMHLVGKVVKVRTASSAEAYYLKAIARDLSKTVGTFAEVTWVEAAGVVNTITSGLYYATNSGTQMHIASTAAKLDAIVTGPAPTFVPSVAGDDDSAPRPFFLGRTITYLGTFQNRLLVGSGGVLACSKTEDYLNFFRSTVLTAPASDAFEMQSAGSEDDELRFSTLYDRNLIIFGSKRQYLISGLVALSPTNANMSVLTQFQDAADSPPIAAGGYLFYAKRGEAASSLHQIQPGQNNDSPESFIVSSQIDDYIQGDAIELVSMGKPSMIFIRTKGNRTGLYVFGYMDTVEGRKLDSWSRWQFSSVLGVVIGMAVVPDGLLVFSLRQGDGSTVYTVCDFCPVISGVSLYPYLDSHRSIATVEVGTGSVTTTSAGNWSAVFDSTSTRPFIGYALSSLAKLYTEYPGVTGLRVGADQECYFQPTNPYMLDSKGKAILTGRLTVSKINVGYRNSGGFSWTLNYRNVVDSSGLFNGRVLGDPTNLIGYEPISTGDKAIPVGRETNDYTLTIAARYWYPLTVTALEWVGQYFNRTQRF